MSVLRHCEPVEFEVCERSGQLPWECGLAACENGCATKTVEFVPAEALERRDVEYAALREDRDRLQALIDAHKGFLRDALNRLGGQ